MVTKTVALDVEAYEMLKRQKRTDESFSDAVKRLARPRIQLSAFAGVWKDLTPQERRELDLVYAELRAADERRSEKLRRRWNGK